MGKISNGNAERKLCYQEIKTPLVALTMLYNLPVKKARQVTRHHTIHYHNRYLIVNPKHRLAELKSCPCDSLRRFIFISFIHHY